MLRTRGNINAQPLRRRGYTFVELTVSLLITAILAKVSTQVVGDSTNRFRADVAARGIVSAIDRVRTNSRVTSAQKRIQFSITNNDYILVGVTNPDNSGQPFVVQLNGSKYSATLVSASLGGDAELIFSVYGVPDSGGTIIVSAGGKSSTINVDATTGKATLQ